jgi:excisionase family DNA binding protein
VAARIPSPAPVAKRLLTIAQAAEYLGRSPKAVEHLVARGVLPVTKLDGKRQIDRIALDKLISESTYFAA